MANTIHYAQVLQNALDQAAVQGMLTGWMDRNAGKVKYQGGKEVKIPELSTDGLANYDRNGGSGYTGGSVELTYKTHEMTQDRGRKFEIDAMDVEESNFLATAGNVMGEFQRAHVIPEIDAYRLAALADVAMKADGDNNSKYSYTPATASIITEIKKGIKVIRENGYNGQLMIHLTYDAMLAIEEKKFEKLTMVNVSVGGIETKVPSIDQCPLIETPQNRMYSKIALLDGKTSGQEKGGYTKAEGAIDCNFIIVPADVPLAITKQDLMRIFDPNTNQNANAWALDYRRYHDLWVKNANEKSVFACFKQAKPASLKTEKDTE